jgi:hypothetical protein
MSPVPQQPETLDPNPANEIKDNAPLAQGHDADDADAMREAQAQHREAVEAAEEAEEVTARDPGDHAEAKKTSAKADKS